MEGVELISIIVYIHNAENSLYYCLNSILKQSYQDFEIICIDDDSTDSSMQKLEYFSCKDSRIQIFKNDYEKGVGYSRNRGLDIAKGDYIYFLDADEWMTLNSLELLIKKANSDNLELLLYKKMNQFNSFQKFGFENCYDELLNKLDNKVFNYFYLNKTNLFDLSNSVNCLYLKSFLDENNVRFSNKKLLDYNLPFFYNAFISSERISFLNQFLCIGRERYKNPKDIIDQLFDNVFVFYEILEVFLKDKHIYKFYKKELLNYIFNNIFNFHDYIDNTTEERFFMEIQAFIKHCVVNCNLYNDISNHVDKDILNKLRFNEIMETILNPPKISIIIPVFNTEDGLLTVLESIIHQTIDFRDLEVIIVNDCSTDNSAQIINDYSRKYDNFHSIHLCKNTGSPSKPRNIGIHYANAEYIIFQDSDDGFLEDACELLYNTIVEENVDVVTGMVNRNDNGADFKIEYYPWVSVISKSENINENDAKKIIDSSDLFKLKLDSIDENPLFLSDYPLNSKIYKKSLFKEFNISFPEYLNGGEDTAVIFNAYINAKGIVFINKVIYNYDVHRPDSLTHNLSIDTVKNRPVAYKFIYDIAIDRNKKDYYVEIVLSKKISYWFNSYLLKAQDIEYEDIFSIIKSQHIIFEECVNYNLKMSPFILDICKDIKNKDFDKATKKIILKRKELYDPNFNLELDGSETYQLGDYLEYDKGIKGYKSENWVVDGFPTIISDEYGTKVSSNLDSTYKSTVLLDDDFELTVKIETIKDVIRFGLISDDKKELRLLTYDNWDNYKIVRENGVITAYHQNKDSNKWVVQDNSEINTLTNESCYFYFKIIIPNGNKIRRFMYKDLVIRKIN